MDAAQKADLSFRVSGKLVSLSAQEGDTVKRGDILARLDDTDFEIQLESREAEYASAHADFLRGRQLVKTGVISQSDFNKLQAQDATAKAALEATRQNLSYTRLKAPFDGRIAVRHVDNFEELNAKRAVYTLQVAARGRRACVVPTLQVSHRVEFWRPTILEGHALRGPRQV